MATIAVALLFTRPDGEFHVTVLSVGAAPAALIQAPDGALAVLDGGSSPTKLDDALGRVLSPVTHTLDLVVMSANSPSTVGALAGLQTRYDITAAVATAPRTAAVTTMLTAFQTAGATVVDAVAQSWRWHGLTWQAFGLGDGSSVIRVSDGRTSALFLGTAGTGTQDDLLGGRGNQLRADLLVAPSGGSVENSLLEAVRPRYIAAPSVPAAPGPGGGWSRFVAKTGASGDLHYSDSGGRLESD
jgi:beta-lactamase superfamily II metal-dependent hydrolase